MFLVKNNKSEVDTILSSDPVLRGEIDYDMKTFAKEKVGVVLSNKTILVNYITIMVNYDHLGSLLSQVIFYQIIRIFSVFDSKL